MIKDNFNLLETEGLFSGSDKKYLYEIKDSISHDERAKEIFNKLINDEYKNLRIRRKRKRLKLLKMEPVNRTPEKKTRKVNGS